jgi:hypothetical protein
MQEDPMKDDPKEPKDDPALKDVEPGSDADATPEPKVGETPPDPNAESGQHSALHKQKRPL